jgi:hypothetical protein
MKTLLESSIEKHCWKVQLENIAGEFSRKTLPQSSFVKNIAGKVQSENIA